MLSWDEPRKAGECCELYKVSINGSRGTDLQVGKNKTLDIGNIDERINVSVRCLNLNSQNLGPGVDIAVYTGMK